MKGALNVEQQKSKGPESQMTQKTHMKARENPTTTSSTARASSTSSTWSLGTSSQNLPSSALFTGTHGNVTDESDPPNAGMLQILCLTGGGGVDCERTKFPSSEMSTRAE